VVTRTIEHPPPESCPDCGGPLGAPVERRKRIIEDIVVSKPEAVEHDIPRCWCPACKKNVEPPVADALPGAAIGHRMIALGAWLHYGLGVTISQIIDIVGRGFQFEISAGGLVQAWHRIAEIVYCWYEQIGEEVRAAGVLHADETGWRVNGSTHWLWCFTSKTATYYMIDRSRGSPALSKFFTSAIDGILVTDFWAAYNAVVCAARQACLPHLLRELEKVDKTNDGATWKMFSPKLKRLLRDALRLAAARSEMEPKKFASRKALINRRLETLLENSWWYEGDAARIAKRLRKFRDALFTFLENPGVPSDNNHAEREIRPAVIMRKNSYCNRSERGANTQAVLMSVYRTLRLRGHDPMATLVNALRVYVETGNLPPLPDKTPSDG
jgi:hypothetical protein